MIRFLQRENRLTKALFIVIIAAASIGMVIYLIPGLTAAQGAASSNTFATIYPRWYSRFFSSGETVSLQTVSQRTRQQLQLQNPQYLENPIIVNMLEQRIGLQMVQQKVLLAEADKLGIRASSDDVIQFLHKGEFGQYLFPNGQFIGTDRYTAFVANQFNLSVADFEDDVMANIVIQRLERLVTAGVTVSDREIRDTYRKDNTKIKFDYAVIAADDLRKTINPSDGDLEAFFKKNAARYATAVPEERKIT